MNEEKDLLINNGEFIGAGNENSNQQNFILGENQPTVDNNGNQYSMGNMEYTQGQKVENTVTNNMASTQVNENPDSMPVFNPMQYSQPKQSYSFWSEQAGGTAYQQGYYFNQAQNNMPIAPKKKSEYKLLKSIGKGALVGLVAAVGFCAVVYGANKMGVLGEKTVSYSSVSGGSTIAPTVVSSENNIKVPNDLTSVVDKCMPSIVSITSTVTESYNSYFGSYDQDNTGSGSGIVLKISEDEVLIVTNNHVIADAKKIMVGFYGVETEKDMVEATVKGTDSGRDLAVVLVKTKNIPEEILENISAIEMGSSDEVKVGEMAIAIGNSLGYGQSLTVGYISAKERLVEIESGDMELLQTDAAINPGNSGGALLDIDGKLIGINSAKYADTSVEGMGFAIPITEAIPIINDLMNREVLTEEEKGYLGVSVMDITEEAQYPNMPIGIYVAEVSEDGAAYQAGIVKGDIIVGVDDQEILKSQQLTEKINSYRIGTEITIKVKRYKEGEYVDKDIKVVLKGKDTLNSLESQQNENNNSYNHDNRANQIPYEEYIDPYSNQDEFFPYGY